MICSIWKLDVALPAATYGQTKMPADGRRVSGSSMRLPNAAPIYSLPTNASETSIPDIAAPPQYPEG